MNDNAHATSRVDMCSLITLAKHHHDNGNLSVVEDNNEIPFKIRRVYYLYDIPGGEERGGHSHRECYTLLVAVSGSFTVVLDDGIERREVLLSRSNVGLLVVPGVWRVLNNFSSGSVCLSVASHLYSEEDYVRDYAQFLQLTKCKRNEKV